jgi:alkanesulfonate monooxygenase SsuD/methylene tetrahydromethanopterin reductase-like flavin-dependent oxidoreductase (luciferase family)
MARLTDYARLANQLGLTWLTSNDHLVYGRPWIDGVVALASVLPAIDALVVATTVALPVVRGPGPLAKALAAIDRFSGGRLVVGVGPGSSERDFRAVGIAWEERWPRFEEAVRALRALFRPGTSPFKGAFYSSFGRWVTSSVSSSGSTTPSFTGLTGDKAGFVLPAGQRIRPSRTVSVA